MPEFPSPAALEVELWDHLQLDMAETGDSPPQLEPVDRAYVLGLIESALARMARFVPEGEGDFPPDLRRAVALDVSVHYDDRNDPELPADYWSLIAPYRAWGFGG